MNYNKIRHKLLTKAIAGDKEAIIELNSVELLCYQQAVRASAGLRLPKNAKTLL